MQEKKSFKEFKEFKEAYVFIVNLINDNKMYNTNVETVTEAQEIFKLFIGENKTYRECEILAAADCANLCDFDSEKLAKIYKYIKKEDEDTSLRIVSEINFHENNLIKNGVDINNIGLNLDIENKKLILLSFIESGSIFGEIPVLKYELYQEGKILNWNLFSMEEENKKMSYKNIKKILDGDKLDDMQKIVDFLKSAPKNEVNALFEASMSERNKKVDDKYTKRRKYHY